MRFLKKTYFAFIYWRIYFSEGTQLIAVGATLQFLLIVFIFQRLHLFVSHLFLLIYFLLLIPSIHFFIYSFFHLFKYLTVLDSAWQCVTVRDSAWQCVTVLDSTSHWMTDKFIICNLFLIHFFHLSCDTEALCGPRKSSWSEAEIMHGLQWQRQGQRHLAARNRCSQCFSVPPRHLTWLVTFTLLQSFVMSYPCLLSCIGFFAYTCGCVIVIENLKTAEQKHLTGHVEEISTLAVQSDCMVQLRAQFFESAWLHPDVILCCVFEGDGVRERIARSHEQPALLLGPEHYVVSASDKRPRV